jgi:RimJ/RimL family protein N-acetyltransferase
MFARTERLTLRPGWPEDAEALHWAIAHRPVVEKLARVPWPYTIDHARDWLCRPAPTMPVLTIHAHDLAPLPRLVGGIGLHPEEDGLNLGYWLTPSAWGRGYATEAGRQVVAMARHALGQTRLAAYHHADNPASGRVLHKLGFREAGRGQRPSLARGHPVDSVLMVLDLREEERPALKEAA